METSGESGGHGEAGPASASAVGHEDGDQCGIPCGRCREGSVRERRRQHPGQRLGGGDRCLNHGIGRSVGYLDTPALYVTAW